MKLQVADIHRPQVIEIQGKEDWLQDIYENLRLASDRGSLIQGHIEIQPLEYGQVQVAGRIQVCPQLSCSRCADSIPWPIDQTFRASFRSTDEIPQESHLELRSDELEAYFIDEQGCIDIESLINDIIQIEIPQQVLARDPQTGECRHCGIDIASDVVYESAPKSEDENPFAVLKNLKLKQ